LYNSTPKNWIFPKWEEKFLKNFLPPKKIAFFFFDKNRRNFSSEPTNAY